MPTVSCFVGVFIFLFAVTSGDGALLKDSSNNDSIIITTLVDTDVASFWIGCPACSYIDGKSSNQGKLPGVPATLITIFPSYDGTSSGIIIETSPPNLGTLVTVEDDAFGPYLDIIWNLDVLSTATSGSSVRICVPSHQLDSVAVDGGHNVQILDGFTNITSLYVEDSGAILHASMTSLISTDLRLDNYGGRMYVETNIPVNHGEVRRSKLGRNTINDSHFY